MALRDGEVPAVAACVQSASLPAGLAGRRGTAQPGIGPTSSPMPSRANDDITILLQRMRGGDRAAEAVLLEALYHELHGRADRLMRGQPADHTLEATALVHEAYMRLIGPQCEPYNDRGHFLAVAAKAMRSVLVDHSRRKDRRKRRAPGKRLELDPLTIGCDDHVFDLLALNEALERLEGFDPEMARAVEMRFFGGLSLEECAAMLGMARRTFERHWQATRAWLYAELQ